MMIIFIKKNNFVLTKFVSKFKILKNEYWYLLSRLIIHNQYISFNIFYEFFIMILIEFIKYI